MKDAFNIVAILISLLILSVVFLLVNPMPETGEFQEEIPPVSESQPASRDRTPESLPKDPTPKTSTPKGDSVSIASFSDFILVPSRMRQWVPNAPPIYHVDSVSDDLVKIMRKQERMFLLLISPIDNPDKAVVAENWAGFERDELSKVRSHLKLHGTRLKPHKGTWKYSVRDFTDGWFIAQLDIYNRTLYIPVWPDPNPDLGMRAIFY